MIKQFCKKLIYGPLSPVASLAFTTISDLEYRYFSRKWKRQGWKKPGQDEIDFVCKNVTVIFKSFER